MTTAAVAPEPVFVDTNVLVYAAVPAFPLHVDARMRLTELEAAGVCLWISRQTLREYLSAISRPSAYSPPIPMTSLIGGEQKGLPTIWHPGNVGAPFAIGLSPFVPLGDHATMSLTTLPCTSVRR
jgi:hypothetical protein